jgi:Ca-activated chloride channel family protein
MIVFICLLTSGVMGQTTTTAVLSGKITDDKSEPLIGASIKVLKGADFVKGAVSDFSGEYRIQIDSGTYDVEFLYAGFSTSRQTGVQVLSGQVNTLNVTMSNSGQVLSEVVISTYNAPLTEQDKQTSGQTLSADQIKKLPTRSINTTKVATRGAGATDDRNVKIKGSRDNKTNYYVDGIRVSGASGKAPVKDKSKSAEKIERKQARKATPSVILMDAQPGIAATKSYDMPAPEMELKPGAGTVRRDTANPELYAGEQYNTIVENPFLQSKDTPVSTFSIDVDAASYANIRRYITAGSLPPRDAVRIEEMINYFKFDYPQPKNEHPFSVNTTYSVCPWEPAHRLLMVGLQGLTVDPGQLPPSNFVFLIDVSGSMQEPNKLPLVKTSLNLLADQLRPQDHVAIAVYAGAAGLVLAPTNNKQDIKDAVNRLEAGGSTAGAEGIELAYQTARNYFQPNGNNRVILCTDGDFNVGISDEASLIKLIEKERASGIFLTVLGYGTGNYQDGKMQQLADKGNGNHAYIDSEKEAEKVLVQEFGGTLFSIAKDVKLQLEFNPDKVTSYRLIGYENRMLAKEDFEDDTKDAGELGSGHTVTAIYEIVPADNKPDVIQKDIAYNIQNQVGTTFSGDLMTLKLRYKPVKGNQSSRLLEHKVPVQLQAPDNNMLQAATVAEFGLLLRNSRFKGAATYAHALAQAELLVKNNPDPYRIELRDLIERARNVSGEPTAGK